MDDVGMKLLERGESKIGCAKSGLEAAAIFDYVFACVPVGEAEVQDFFIVEVTNTTGAGAEAVDEPGEFVQSSDLEYADAIGGGFRPVGAGRGPGGIPANPAFLSKRLRACHGLPSIIGMESCAMGTGREDAGLARVRSTDNSRDGSTGHRLKPVPLEAHQ